MRAAFIASILPPVMKEGERKKDSSHCDRKPLNLIGDYGNDAQVTNIAI